MMNPVVPLLYVEEDTKDTKEIGQQLNDPNGQ